MTEPTTPVRERLDELERLRAAATPGPWQYDPPEGDGRARTAVHHLVLEDVVPLAEPVPCRGALGLWRPSEDVVRECGGAIVGASR